MTSDILYGMRTFARRPGFTSLVVVILAVGIGFVTMIARGREDTRRPCA
jgi:hypothetical protein